MHVTLNFDMFCMNERTTKTRNSLISNYILGKDLALVKCIKADPSSEGCCPFEGGGFIVLCTSHCLWGLCVGLCFGMQCIMFFSSFSIILTRKREMVALL